MTLTNLNEEFKRKISPLAGLQWQIYIRSMLGQLLNILKKANIQLESPTSGITTELPQSQKFENSKCSGFIVA